MLPSRATKNVVCAVMAADCMPVLLADESGAAVGIAHAGWRGLCAGVIEATVAAMGVPPAPPARVARSGDRAARPTRSATRCARRSSQRDARAAVGVRADAARPLAPRSLRRRAPAPRRAGRDAGFGRRLLHRLGSGALLFLPQRQGQRAHGRRNLARASRVQSRPPCRRSAGSSPQAWPAESFPSGAAAFALFLRAAWISTLVSFAIGALLGAAFLEVIPHAFEHGDPHTRGAVDPRRHPGVLPAGEAAAVAPLARR